ncbi:MAG: type IV secretion system DNA-binding domain-containing protein [Gammaproteobacteria bacterium]
MAHFDALKGEQKTSALTALFIDTLLSYLSVFGLSFCVSVLGAIWIDAITLQDLNNAGVWVLGTFLDVALFADVPLKFYAPEGIVVAFPLSDFEQIRTHVSASLEGLQRVLLLCAALSVCVSIGVRLAYRRASGLGLFGAERSRVFLRGGTRLPEADLAAHLIKQRQDSDLKVGQMPLVRDSENRHLLMVGDTGVGKSQAIMQLLSSIRARGEKVFIYDPSGDFVKHFYRADHDVLLAPFDARSLNWTPFAEGEDYHALERVASSFCPPGVDGDKNKHWDDAANLIFTALLHAIAHDPHLANDTESIVRSIAAKTKRVHVDELGNERITIESQLDRLIKGTLAEGVISSESPTHRADVLATVIPKIRSLQYLLGLEDRDLFSITEWVNRRSDQWVFVRVNENQLKLSQALITAWIDTVVTAVLSRKPHPAERLWLVMDETQGLGRISSLHDAVEKGRKYNFACVMGFTSHKKMAHIYGDLTVSSLLSSLSTKLCFRYSNPDASEWVSKLLGEEEVIEGRTSMGRSQESSVSEQDEKRRNALVIPTEIQNLEDLKCYLKLPGNLPISCVQTHYQAREVVADYWQPRQMPAPIVVGDITVDERQAEKPVLEEPFI